METRQKRQKAWVICAKYVLVLVLCMLSVLAIFFSPDLYHVSDLNFGPVLAFVAAGAGTLVWNSIGD